MAPRVRINQLPSTKPAEIVRSSFYPGEVARILGLEGMDYHQLRRLFRLVREQGSLESPETRKWSRFTFKDLVALKVAVTLAGGKEALSKGRHLRLKDVERTCQRLREAFGLENPLTEVVLRRRGKSTVARVQGLWFEPANGQMVLAEVEEAVEQYLQELRQGEQLPREMQKEASKLRKRRGRRGRIETLPARAEIQV
jgi:hypothetical protein